MEAYRTRPKASMRQVQPQLKLWWRDSPALTAAFRRRLGEAREPVLVAIVGHWLRFLQLGPPARCPFLLTFLGKGVPY